MNNQPVQPRDFIKGDEVQVMMNVLCFQGKVMLDFGKAVSQIGLDPADAMQLANLIIHSAETISAHRQTH